MGIYIPNLKMPKEIDPALVIDFCEDLSDGRYARFYHYRYGGLTNWYEVLEIPEPHGQLGNLDALIKKTPVVSYEIYENIKTLLESTPPPLLRQRRASDDL